MTEPVCSHCGKSLSEALMKGCKDSPCVKDASNIFRAEDYAHWINRIYVDEYNQRWLLDGIMLGSDDWYWCFWGLDTAKRRLCSCVGDPKQIGFTLLHEASEDPYYYYRKI